MINYNPLYLPSSAELPDSDDTPVDNELQILIPNLLRLILNWLWSDSLQNSAASRNDWFFGVNMGLYHTTGNNPRTAIVPDGFLSVGVPRLKNGKLRLSYVVWEENDIVPILALEVVSRTYGEEYDNKMNVYAKLRVLYYVIYNPDYWRRDRHDPFEVYRLVGDSYVRQLGEPIFMPEIGLGIGRAVSTHDRCQREWLYWYSPQGTRFPTPDEVVAQERQRAEQERQRAEQERQRAERLAARLRAMGIDLEAE